METKSRTVSQKQKESEKIDFEHLFSAFELGELMNNNPLALLELDLGFQTKWYNCDVIEEAMSFIREEADMYMFMTLIVESWREQTVKRNPRVAYRDPKTKETIPYVEDLENKLNIIHDRLMGEREQIKKVSAFREMFLKKYSGPSNETEILSLKQQVKQKNTASLSSHNDQTDSGTKPFRVLLEDLPEKVRSKILVNQNTFDIFVNQINEDTWPIVEAQKGTLCDALRFVCIKRQILAGDTDRETFDLLLHFIIKGYTDQPSLLSSIKRRTDTSANVIKRNLLFYDSPVKRHQKAVWRLIQDCGPIEDSLQPVYEAMEDNDD